MKIEILALFFLSVVFYSCKENSEKNETAAPVIEYTVYGDSFDPKQIMQASELINYFPKNDSDVIVFSGIAQQVCEKKGCWVDVALNDTITMKIRFKDYAFFVPTTLEADTFIAKGFLYRDTLSIEELRHYAKDEGLSDEEINKINQPEYSYLFEASGLLVKK